MSDKKWYENLKSGDLVGKHVHVEFSNGTMDGCLNLHGEIPYWADDDDWRYVQILEQGHDQVWRPAIGVESVSLVWDERDWEQIRTEGISKADAIVVNGRLLHVKNAFPGWFFTVEDPYVSTSFHAVSCALRRRPKLPTEPGFYRSDSDDLLYLTDDSEWRRIEVDYVVHLSSLPTHFLPLTPVHFVDGRAE